MFTAALVEGGSLFTAVPVGDGTLFTAAPVGDEALFTTAPVEDGIFSPGRLSELGCSGVYPVFSSHVTEEILGSQALVAVHGFTWVLGT